MMESRFGIPPRAFEGVSFFRRGRKVWAFSLPEIPDLRCESVGLRFISARGKVPKPTTVALQLFGRAATKNVIDLSAAQAERFIAGERQELEADAEDGYVVVSYRGGVLGCGLYSGGELISQLPKERRITKDGIENRPPGGCGR
ncbi:methyltransferase RsmF C-terminal domain-like protein [Methanocrinis sp.]|uniref:methyltransferase RsmF C-terminal domain-like protein n=1 Tax=Methanocrinis sp. TaxID=3101522 RepID=UPI003D146DFB